MPVGIDFRPSNRDPTADVHPASNDNDNDNGGDTPPFLGGDGEMARLIRRFDWARTPLGPPRDWSPSLKVIVRMALSTRHPVFVFWGPQHICLYNDGYRPSLGPEKHPAILGMPAQQAWPEIWPLIGPQIEQVLGGDGGTWHENQLIPIVRHGGLQDVYWTYSYGPIDDAAAAHNVGGVLVLCTETTRQVQAEQKLADEVRRLAKLFEQAPSFMALLRGPGHVFELANRAYVELIGNRALLGLSVAQALPEVVEQGFVGTLDAVYRSGKPYSATAARVEIVSSTSVRREHVIDFIYQPTTGADGAVDGILVVGVDVTARHSAETALQFSEQQLRLAIDAGEIGLWDVDPVNDTLYWAPLVRRMFGIAADRAVSLHDFYAGLHPLDREATAAAFAAALDPAVRALYDVEYRVIARDNGEQRWVAAKGRGMFDDQGRCVRVLGTAIDITRRRARDAELRELNDTLERRVAQSLAERRVLANVVEGTASMIQVIDADFAWLAVNRAAAAEFTRQFGRRPRVGAKLLDELAAHPVQRDTLQALWRRALAGETFSAIEEFGQRHHEMRFDALRDDRGERIGAYQIAVDVTERLLDQQRLAAAEAALRQAQKMEAIGQLTGGIAHDFNNLLQALGGNIELIRRKAADAKQVAIWAERSAGVLARGARLTSQLLTFSREQAPKLRSVPVLALIEGMRDLLRSTLGSPVRLKLMLPAAEVFAVADSTQLEMAVLNLAINARDAMVAGGEMILGVAELRLDDDLQLPAGDYVRLSVSDSGSGMDAHVAQRAFDPFFTTKGVGKGSGLGLSQVYGMAQRAGGSARIETVPGHGSTVSIWLRRADPAGEHAQGTDFGALEPAAGAAVTVLVVDDDGDVRQLLAEALQALGHQVLQAADGQAGLAVLASNRVDAIVVDFAMPGMNGAEFARRARERLPDLPVLVVSGHSDSAALDAAVGAEVALLRKPFELGTLQAAFAKLVRGSPGFAGTAR